MSTRPSSLGYGDATADAVDPRPGWGQLLAQSDPIGVGADDGPGDGRDIGKVGGWPDVRYGAEIFT